MKFRALRRVSSFSLALGLVACGAGDHALPTSPAAARPVSQAVQPVAAGTGIDMPVAAQGAPPPGFVASFRVDPRPDADGVIRGDSPLTVEFDMCGSKTDADKTLTFLYDWDFNNVADVVGTGDACRQQHRYNGASVDAEGNLSFHTNVCLVSGDPRTPNSPDTHYGCRPYTISLAKGFVHHTGWGQTWFNGVHTGAHTLSQAALSCQQFIQANHPHVGQCVLTGCGCGNSPCVFDDQTFIVWFYAGDLSGNSTVNSCSTGELWD